ncbi:MAG: hypothetical protein EXS05_23180 [Planctomycetaceae bacterium]|nr:hypothetical protein [Planctomycetaceae bacterium]
MQYRTKRSPWVAWAVGLTLFLPVFYVLSLGPLIALGTRGLLPKVGEFAFEIYVIPAQFLYEIGPQPVRNALEWRDRFFRNI